MTQRERWRRNKRRERARKRRVGQVGSRFCQERESRWKRCGAPVEHRRDALGRVLVICHRCERRQAGICVDCPRKVRGVPGRGPRCPACSKRHQRVCSNQWTARNLELKRLQCRESARRRSGYYARRGLTPPPVPTLAEWTTAGGIRSEAHRQAIAIGVRRKLAGLSAEDRAQLAAEMRERAWERVARGEVAA